jgi:hypothetical protein
MPVTFVPALLALAIVLVIGSLSAAFLWFGTLHLVEGHPFWGWSIIVLGLMLFVAAWEAAQLWHVAPWWEAVS